MTTGITRFGEQARFHLLSATEDQARVFIASCVAVG